MNRRDFIKTGVAASIAVPLLVRESGAADASPLAPYLADVKPGELAIIAGQDRYYNSSTVGEIKDHYGRRKVPTFHIHGDGDGHRWRYTPEQGEGPYGYSNRRLTAGWIIERFEEFLSLSLPVGALVIDPGAYDLSAFVSYGLSASDQLGIVAAALLHTLARRHNLRVFLTHKSETCPCRHPDETCHILSNVADHFWCHDVGGKRVAFIKSPRGGFLDL